MAIMVQAKAHIQMERDSSEAVSRLGELQVRVPSGTAQPSSLSGHHHHQGLGHHDMARIQGKAEARTSSETYDQLDRDVLELSELSEVGNMKESEVVRSESLRAQIRDLDNENQAQQQLYHEKTAKLQAELDALTESRACIQRDQDALKTKLGELEESTLNERQSRRHGQESEQESKQQREKEKQREMEEEKKRVREKEREKEREEEREKEKERERQRQAAHLAVEASERAERRRHYEMCLSLRGTFCTMARLRGGLRPDTHATATTTTTPITPMETETTTGTPTTAASHTTIATTTTVRDREGQAVCEFVMTGGGRELRVTRWDKSAVPSQPRRPRHDTFTLDGIFGAEATSEAVFDEAVRPMVWAALGGRHAVVLAYGASGTGKTYTVTALRRLIVGMLLDEVEDVAVVEPGGEENDNKRRMMMSYIEVGKGEKAEEVVDLFSHWQQPNTDKGHHGRNHQSVATSTSNNNNVGWDKTSQAIPITSWEEASRHITQGDEKRRTSPTRQNAVSSRSHALFTLSLDMPGDGDGNGNGGSITLVDLAGNESLADTGAPSSSSSRTTSVASSNSKNGTAFRDTAYINTSLSNLKTFIGALGGGGGRRGQVSRASAPDALTRALAAKLGVSVGGTGKGPGGTDDGDDNGAGGVVVLLVVTVDLLGDERAVQQAVRTLEFAREAAAAAVPAQGKRVKARKGEENS
ncbi:P-loop containing nucleoside triphosphate hydrolase protein [Xylariaceae sp. FL0804]|nr:P-loop containing nucleoside triphosphate hydrolase protein [Xylariaceae sp. FL0804]